MHVPNWEKCADWKNVLRVLYCLGICGEMMGSGVVLPLDPIGSISATVYIADVTTHILQQR